MQNSELEQKVKDARRNTHGGGPRHCQKRELDMAAEKSIKAQQKLEETLNKLSGVKMQRESLSNQLRDERKRVEVAEARAFESQRKFDALTEQLANAEQKTQQVKEQLHEHQCLVRQLQQLHSDAQNLLHRQEQQHKRKGVT